MKYTVKITTNFNTGDYDSFEIETANLESAQKKATEEAVKRGYDAEDVSVEEIEEEKQVKIKIKANEYNILNRKETYRLFENDPESIDYLNEHTEQVACVYTDGELIQYQIIEPDMNPGNIDDWIEDGIEDCDMLEIID